MIEIKLELAFKGKRNYLQGGDLFNSLQSTLRENLKSDIWVNWISYRSFARKKCYAMLPDTGLQSISEKCADFSFYINDEIKKGVIIETDEEIYNRVDFNENSIIDNCEIENKSISQLKRSQYSSLEDIIALTKHLHNYHYPPDSGKWVFLQLQLSEPLNEVNHNYKITIDKVLNSRFSKSIIEDEKKKYGWIGFGIAAL